MKSKLPLAIPGLLLLTTSLAAGQATFTRITTGPVVNDGGISWACAWGDYDNDGFIDLFVANAHNPALNLALAKDFLYRNNGNGTFTKITNGIVVNDTADSAAGAWADYDNDGWLDLFVATDDINPSGQPGQLDLLYQNDGGGVFIPAASSSIVTTLGTSVGCAWGDYDNDGHVDLFVGNRYGQSSFLYHNNGDGTFTRITEGSLVNTPANALGAAWADYDGDGYLDLFVATAASPGVSDSNDWLYRNNRDGTFTRITGSPVVTSGGQSYGGVWGDYDNDGDFDLYVGNAEGGQSFLFRNDGGGSFVRITDAPIGTDSGDMGACAWANYDNDGFLDLFNANYLGGPSWLYHNNGDGTFTRIASGNIVTDSAASAGVAWGDYDNDGFQDLFVANEGGFQSENNFLYHNDGNTNRWLTLTLKGTVSNRSAIGAKVRVLARYRGADRWQLRQISATGCASGQNDMRVAFGLAEATNVNLVRIEWPSGIVQELKNVAANQFITIIEPPLLKVIGRNESGEFHFTVNGARGQIYMVQYSTNLTHWSTLTNFMAITLSTSLMDSSGGPTRFYRAASIPRVIEP